MPNNKRYRALIKKIVIDNPGESTMWIYEKIMDTPVVQTNKGRVVRTWRRKNTPKVRQVQTILTSTPGFVNINSGRPAQWVWREAEA